MNKIALASGLGFIIGVILFLVFALTGYIDKWTAKIEKMFAPKNKNAESSEKKQDTN